MSKIKKIITWIILIILIILLLALNYIKFIGLDNQNIQEKPSENSTATAINNALTEIVNNYNNNIEVENLTKEGIFTSAILKNYSIFITYVVNEQTTTYEFHYNNLILTTTTLNQEENLKKFLPIFKILINSCQERLNNNQNIDNTITEFLENRQEVNGLTQKKSDSKIVYTIDITRKIENEDNQIPNDEMNNSDNINQSE